MTRAADRDFFEFITTLAIVALVLLTHFNALFAQEAFAVTASALAATRAVA
ncbi:MAG: hypothetical protein ACK5JM_04925 [Rhodoblastus sp.]